MWKAKKTPSTLRSTRYVVDSQCVTSSLNEAWHSKAESYFQAYCKAEHLSNCVFAFAEVIQAFIIALKQRNRNKNDELLAFIILCSLLFPPVGSGKLHLLRHLIQNLLNRMQNATLRYNVTFGCPFEQEKYEKVSN